MKTVSIFIILITSLLFFQISLSSQNVGIGTSNPRTPLEVRGNTDTTLYVVSNGDEGKAIYGLAGGGGSGPGIERYVNFGGYFISRSRNGRGLYAAALPSKNIFTGEDDFGKSYGTYIEASSVYGIGLFSKGNISGQFDGNFIINDNQFFMDKSE